MRKTDTSSLARRQSGSKHTQGRRVSSFQGGNMHGQCAFHQRYENVEKHHDYPKRWFGKQQGTKHITLLCPQAHRDLEKVLEYFERQNGDGERIRLSKHMYNQMLQMFLGGQFERLIPRLKGDFNEAK